MDAHCKPVKSTGLYVDRVLGRTVIYNPSSERGILVAGAGIRRILRYCHEGQSIGYIAKRLSLSLKDMAGIVKKMADYEILSLRGYKPALFRPENQSWIRVWVHITNACNLACRYCYVNKDGSKMDKAIVRKLVDALIRSVSGHKDIRRIMYTLAGGEPLTNLAAVKEVLAYSQIKARRSGIGRTVAVITNGTILNSGILALIKHNNAGISVSVDGLDRMNVNRMFRNGRDSTVVILRNIDRLIKSGTRPFILITLTPENLKGLPAFTRYLLERKLGFSFSLVRDPSVSLRMKAYSQEVIRVLMGCYDLMEELLPRRPYYLRHKFENISLTSHNRRGCSLGRRSFVVSHDGNVYLCQMDVGSSRKIATVADADILGRVRAQTVYPELNEYQDAKDYPGCFSCGWKYQCAGGCPLLTRMIAGRIGQPSPYCAIYGRIIPRLIRLEAVNFITASQKEPE